MTYFAHSFWRRATQATVLVGEQGLSDLEDALGGGCVQVKHCVAILFGSSALPLRTWARERLLW